MAIYYTFFESLLYIWNAVISWVESVIRPAMYSKQGQMYNKMYNKKESLYISKFVSSKALQQICIVCILNFHKVHRDSYKNYTFQKGFITYIETLRAFIIHSIHRAIQEGKR